MIDVHEVLRTKEDDILRVRKEIQALLFVAPMLHEPGDPEVPQPDADPEAATFAHEGNLAAENPLPDEFSLEPAEVSQAIPPKRSRLRNFLGLAAGE